MSSEQGQHNSLTQIVARGQYRALDILILVSGYTL